MDFLVGIPGILGGSYNIPRKISTQHELFGFKKPAACYVVAIIILGFSTAPEKSGCRPNQP